MKAKTIWANWQFESLNFISFFWRKKVVQFLTEIRRDSRFFLWTLIGDSVEIVIEQSNIEMMKFWKVLNVFLESWSYLKMLKSNKIDYLAKSWRIFNNFFTVSHLPLMIGLVVLDSSLGKTGQSLAENIDHKPSVPVHRWDWFWSCSTWPSFACTRSTTIWLDRHCPMLALLMMTILKNPCWRSTVECLKTLKMIN